MKCPVCEGVRMREVEKDGVLIDVCPDCKGVWLDRGELDKLMQGMRQMQDDYDRLEQQYYEGGTRGGNTQAPSVPPAGGYGQAPQGGYAPQQHSQPPQGSYGQQPNYNGNYGQHGNAHHGNGKYGYDKYGRPKKKKTMLDVFGDLFD
ncbi:zf-TFIIB domain-containing protein [Paenibacillus mendelii]|uniref:Zf-TFIIB domain-containing protein n=1 Tax=Paenibacillus mendelii TaxID=206163 RepID=A0ABV6JAS5_9BACL|nr:zf-TFIIB domain-containing protein [Paenibacillus mendelii]